MIRFSYSNEDTKHEERAGSSKDDKIWYQAPSPGGHLAGQGCAGLTASHMIYIGSSGLAVPGDGYLR